MSKHISYSALKLWSECPFRYKLVYVDNVGKFTGNEYTRQLVNCIWRELIELAEKATHIEYKDFSQKLIYHFRQAWKVERENFLRQEEEKKHVTSVLVPDVPISPPVSPPVSKPEPIVQTGPAQPDHDFETIDVINVKYE